MNNIPPRPATNEGIIKYGPDDEFNTVTRQQNGQDAYFQQKPGQYQYIRSHRFTIGT